MYYTSRNIHSKMYQNLATQAQRALHLLNDNIKTTVGFLAPKLALKMFDTHVLPILEQNSEMWFSNKKIDEVEKIQLKFLKNILGVRNQTSTVGILADTERYPLIVRQHVSAIKYLQRLNSNICPLMVKNCYNIQKQLKTLGSLCWYSRLMKIIQDNNINELQNIDKVPTILYSRAQFNLFAEISDTNKYSELRTYKTF